jgi:N-methylhydantoinase B/oxoprolinase/acetone carboxylase alpha subunit
VRVLRLSIRRGSGGRATAADQGGSSARGGDGLVKHIEFLAPVRLTVAGTRRRSQPAAAGDAAPGRRGIDRVVIAGRTIHLRAGEAVDIPRGGQLKIATPGGGGYRAGGARKPHPEGDRGD